MAIEKVREYFDSFHIAHRILEFDNSSATVELAALAVGVIPARIAKTLSFKQQDSCILVVTAGDTKIDAGKFKKFFGVKASMLPANEVLDLIGHDVGGVCPFATAGDIPVFLDISLKRFETVYPACGSDNSAIELSCDELFKYSNARQWVDVCKLAPQLSH